MWKLVLCGGLLVIAGAVSETAQAQERSPTTVEGYVFNKWTGVPLEGARMLLTFGNPEIAIGEPLPAGQLITDSNGFYSIEIQSGQLIGLSANCFFQKRGESRGASVSICSKHARGCHDSQSRRPFSLRPPPNDLELSCQTR
jgi:hypothetical protein